MRYRRLNSDGDMTFGNGHKDFLVDSPEAVAQAVITRLKLWLGEWFIDESEGMPWLQSVIGYGTNDTAEPAVRRHILQTQGVLTIESFSFEKNSETREIKIDATVNTIYGSATIEVAA